MSCYWGNCRPLFCFRVSQKDFLPALSKGDCGLFGVYLINRKGTRPQRIKLHFHFYLKGTFQPMFLKGACYLCRVTVLPIVHASFCRPLMALLSAFLAVHMLKQENSVWPPWVPSDGKLSLVTSWAFFSLQDSSDG